MSDRKLWQTCREAKDALPNKTNQDIADDTGLSVNAVSQFLRGETRNPSMDTAGPICAVLNVSMDEHYGVEHRPDASAEELVALRAELAHTRAMCKTWRAVAIGCGVIVVLALGALIVDLCNPNVGWVRASVQLWLQAL